MKCSVLGCDEETTVSCGRNDEFHFCREHWTAWGYYHDGFRRGKGFGCDGLIHRKVWDEAMKEFLEHCRVEIVALQQLGISKDASIEEAYGAVISKQRPKGGH